MVITRESVEKPSEIINLDDILGEQLDQVEPEKKERVKKDGVILLPPLPVKKVGERVDQEIGFGWLDKLTEEDQLRQIMIYVYRISPVVVREPKHIEKFESTSCSDFGFGYLKTTHGGGNYQAMVNRIGSGENIFKFNITIDPSIYPPHIPIGEIDSNSSKNERFINEKIRKGEWKFDNGKLVEVEKGRENMASQQTPIDHVAIMEANNKLFREMVQTLKPPPTPPPAKEDHTMILTLISSMQESSKLMMQQMQANSDNQMKMFLAMMSESNKKIDPPKPDDTLIKFIMEELKTTKEQSTKLMEVLMNQKPSDPMKQMMTTMQFIDEIKGKVGGDNGESKDWKERLADVAIEHGPTLLAMVSGGLNAQQRGLAPEVGIQQVANGPVGYTASNPLPQPIQPSRPVPAQPVYQNDLEALLANPAAMGIVATKINEDMRGWEFGSLITDLYGRPAYNQIANLGELTIFETISRNSQLRSAISTFSDEKLKIWIKEFVNMDNEIKEQEVEHETIN